METRNFETGPSPKITIVNIGGDLRVRSHEADSVEVQSGSGGNMKAELENDELTIVCDVDCLIDVPLEASVDGQVIGGDASFRGFSGDVSVRTVGGSLGLRSVGAASVETVGGRVTARQLTGALSVDRAGGGANVDQVQGDVRLSRVEGEVQVSAGGDARVSLAPKGDAKSAVSSGGDLNCTIVENASVNITLIAGGDLRLTVPVDATDIPGGCKVRLGDSEAELKLTSGGDLILRSGSDVDEVAVVDLGEAIAARVGAEIEAHMYEIEDGLSGLGDRLQSFDSEKIGNKIRSSIEKAQRKAAKAQRKAARQRRTATTIKFYRLRYAHKK